LGGGGLTAGGGGHRRGWSAFDPGEGPVRLARGAAAAARAAWPAGVPERMAATAADLAAGRISLLGAQWRLRADSLPPWLQDPVTGGNWPGAEAYCFDIGYRQRDGFGDIKYVWELSRLQILPPLAFHAVRSQDARLADWIWASLASWMEANPPFRGPNWNSGIELGLRTVSVLLAVSALGPAALDAGRRRTLRSFMAAHGFWLARFPSRYSSANNHSVAEGLGLTAIAAAAPDLPGAPAWRRIGEAALQAGAQTLFTEDGVGREQSPTYAAFTAEMLAVAVLLGGHDDEARATIALRERLKTVAAGLRAFMDEAGNVPHIGDDDETRVLAQPPDREPRYVASVLASLAGLTGRSDLAPPGRDPHLRDLLFDAPLAAGVPEGPGLRADVSGYSILRERMAGRQALLVFDHAPLGHLSIAAHGHADTLAIWLHLDDSPVLVDAGTYLYHSGGAWRDAMRDTALHNTVTVEGRGSSAMAGPFLWGRKAEASLLDVEPGTGWSVTARHDGFRGLGLWHERRVARREAGFAVADRLAGAAMPRDAALSYLFHPELTVEPGGHGFGVRRGGDMLMELEPPAGFTAEVVRGDEERRLGWYSPAFGSRQPACQLVIAGRLGQEWAETRFCIKVAAL
jgi:hypothetical protein